MWTFGTTFAVFGNPFEETFGGAIPIMPIPVITSTPTTSATLGQVFSYQIVASNIPTGYNAKYLPAGLNLNSSTGVIEGYPETTGSFLARLRAFNAAGTSDDFVLTVNVAGDTADPIPANAALLMAAPTNNIYANYNSPVANTTEHDNVVVGTTSTLIAPTTTTPGKKTITHPGGTNTVYLSIGRAAVVNSGFPLPVNSSWTTDATSSAVYGIVSTGTETVSPFY